MEKSNPKADKKEGEGTTPTEKPTVESTTETDDSKVSEDSNPTSKRPETVPYETFSESRRELKDTKQENAELRAMIGTLETPSKNPESQPATGNKVPSEFILEDGSIDINGYTVWMQSQMPSAESISQKVSEDLNKRQILRDMKSKEDTALFAKYPDLREDSEKLSLIDAMKNHSLINGTYMSRTEAADKIFNITSAEANKVKDRVKEDRQIQERVVTSPTSPAKIDEASTEEKAMVDIKLDMQSSDPAVRNKARLKLFELGAQSQ